ncbi:MAG: patatin like phospholipase [bacterium]|nr:patatin like phospholipase [bacterium]
MSAVGQARTALVLAGGAARGAYEVGVVLHILEDVSRALGREVPIDILSGTSVGAINATALAALADRPRARGEILRAQWLSLKLNEVVNPDGRGVFDTIRGLFGSEPKLLGSENRRGGIVDPKGIERIITRSIPFDRIADNIRAGHLQAVTVSATHIRSGRTTVFVQQGPNGPRYQSNDPTVVGVPTTLTPDHALASAAIPFLFPAVRLDGEFYSDGGLRQNVPLAPALRLGADRLIIVSPRHLPAKPALAVAKDRSQDFPGPFSLLGKALNSLLLDRIDHDLDRLEAINDLMEAGERRFGSAFPHAINDELAQSGRVHRIRRVRTALIRATQDIGGLAAEFVRSGSFAKRVHGVIGRVMRRIADATADADLLPYLLFDGEFAAQLIELGRADARARHEELCALFDDVVRMRAAA